MTDKAARFEKNVFINCPFDPKYIPMLHVLIFTIIECDLEPRIALEEYGSEEVRINKIKELIRCSKYSIHDISRMEPLKSGDLPRFNLPFELGLDMGCKTYGTGKLATKKCLILEKTKFQYLKVISDLAGNDIEAHNSNVKVLLKKVRNWISAVTGKSLSGPKEIWENFNFFYDEFVDAYKKKYFDDDEVVDMPIVEYIDFVKEWLAKHPEFKG